MGKYKSMWVLLAVLGPILVSPAGAQKKQTGGPTIKKCQDASGTWHYGDFAAQECERAKVTEINQRGIKVKEHARIPTKEELAAQAAEREKARKEAERLATIRREEQRLLNTYDSADAIVRARDDRVIAIDRDIATNNELKHKFVAEAKALRKANNPKQKKRQQEVAEQIALFDEANKSLTRERKEVIDHYNELYVRYQTLILKRSAKQ